jgi:phage terminase large subunit
LPRELKIETAKVFRPLLEPARYKGGHGGRGSGKSHFFAELMVEDALRFPSEANEGLRGICFREVQKDLSQSAKKLIEIKLSSLGLGEADGFKVFQTVIKTPKDGVIIFNGLQDHTADSIKSLESFHRAWGEEFQSITARSLGMLRPTIRWENKSLGLTSEIWASWNPRRKVDPIDVMLRGAEKPSNSIVVRANWSDNPWFPNVLEQERIDCLRMQPDQYGHIWEGDYVTVVDGAYFAKQLNEAKLQGRIGRVAADPLLPIKLIADIGGTGKLSDNFVFWAVQFVGREIRWLNHYEAQGQEIGEHLNWMRSQGYGTDRAEIILPHDGSKPGDVFRISYRSAFSDAGYQVRVIENQGAGAATLRVEALRRIFPACWFNEATTQGGRDALGWYHEKKDEERGIGLGPDHDWSSHSADAAGLVAVVYEAPVVGANEPKFKRRAIL